jgi:anti-anti-sigma regulatory factor
MTTNAHWIKVDPERVVHTLQQDAIEKVNAAEGEVVLDFSGVPRIDSSVVRALEELAALAGNRSVKVVLRAVNMDIYRVLKLLKLTQRFSFHS